MEGGGGSHHDKMSPGFIPVKFVKFCCKLVKIKSTFTPLLAFDNLPLDIQIFLKIV